MTQKREVSPVHDGATIKRFVALSPLLMTRVAEQMGVTHSTLLGYYERPSVRTDVLWRASKVLGRNFFYDIGMRLPAELPSGLSTELTRRVAELERENERLRIENEVYKGLLGR